MVADKLSLTAKVKLLSGYDMPILGLGVFENDDCRPACLAALDCGYRHIDTAEYYKNEVEVGHAVRESGIPREDVFITTKIYHPDFGFESTKRHVTESLKKFKLDYIDLYLIHSPLTGKKNRLETYKALLSERDEGRIRSVGVSNYGIKHLEEIREAGLEKPTVNQLELHPLCQQRDIVSYCNERGIVIQAYSPLIRGDFDHAEFRAIAEQTYKEPAQVLIRWSLQHGYVPLPKSAHASRVKSNADVFGFELSSEQMAMLDGMDRGGDGAVTWNPVDAA